MFFGHLYYFYSPCSTSVICRYPPRSLFLSPSRAVKYWWRVNNISSLFQRNDAAQPPSLSWLFFSLFFPHSCVFVMPPCFIYDGSWAFFFLFFCCCFFFLHHSSLPLFLWRSFVSLDWQWMCVILSLLMDLHGNTHTHTFLLFFLSLHIFSCPSLTAFKENHSGVSIL